MKLFEEFAQRGYHSCVMTTFSIDFSAFENIALPRLRMAGCNNNLIVADAGMLMHALSTAPELPQQAGRQYTITGAASKWLFHSKVILQLGRKGGRLFVSSANITAPGLAGNLEVVGEVTASSERIGECRLLAAAWQYLGRFLDMEQEAVAHQVAAMRKRARWLMDVEPAVDAVSISGGEEAAFLVGNGKRTIASRFVDLLGGDRVKRLIVVSPYWDEDLKALRDLHRATDAREVCVLVGGREPSFPSTRLVAGDGIQLYALETGSPNRFVHAKVVIAQTRDADHVLYGSANCTAAGIGAAGAFTGRNDEACLYRRMKPGAAIRELRLETTIANENRPTKLPTWQVQPAIPVDAAFARNPGRFEVRGGHLLWWPSAAYDVPDARIELIGRDETALSVTLVCLDTREEGYRRYVISDADVIPHFARVRVGGLVSIAAVVVMPEILRHQIREARTRQQEGIADHLKGRERLGLWIMDFIDLIAQAEAVDTEGSDSTARKVGGRPESRKPPAAVDSKTLTYDAFVAGRHLRADKKFVTMSAFAGSDLELVHSYLNRLIGRASNAVNEEGNEDSESIRAALALHDEIEPDGEGAELEGPKAPDANNERLDEKRKKEEADKARKAIAVRLSARHDIARYSETFCGQMREKADRKLVVMQDVLRLRAVLMVMLGSSCPIGTGVLNAQASDSQVLRADGSSPWPRLIGRVLSAFFGGEEPAINGLPMRARDELPVELLECFATCFWSVHACATVASERKELLGVSAHLRGLTNDIYRLSGLTREEFTGETVTTIFEKMSSTFLLGISPEHMRSMHAASISRKAADHIEREPTPGSMTGVD